LDASFLHLEDGAQHMHMACVMIFDGQAPSYDRFVAHIEERLHLVPRYRQKLARVPLAQDRPVWVDDADFDTRYHVRTTALPGRGSEYELQVLAGRVFSVPLNRSKPLWDMWLVEGLEGGRFAVLSKTHHALVDGISGLDILSVLFAPDGGPGQTAVKWQPEPAPSGLRLLADAVWRRATSPTELIRPARAVLRRPGRALQRVFDTAVGLGALAWAGLSPAPQTRYNSRVVGPDRRFVWVRGSLADLKAIKNSLGGSVNDVVLAVVAGALRRHLLRVGEDVEGLVLRAFVPVSLRPDADRGKLGNQVSGMLVALDVSCADPSQCLAKISTELSAVKESGQVVGAGALTDLAGFAPPALLNQGARLIARQRFINLVVTNVPGPQEPLYMDGHELQDIFPMVPLGTNLGLGIAILSYNGTMNFGLVGDFDAMPDLEDLAGDFEAALEDLREAAHVPAPPARAPRFARNGTARNGTPALAQRD
jgi:diacylglycerol O-acyltransferase / wax synthase